MKQHLDESVSARHLKSKTLLSLKIYPRRGQKDTGQLQRGSTSAAN